MPPNALALLQDMHDGTLHPIYAPEAQIGTASASNVMLFDDSVARQDAAQRQDTRYLFVIENRTHGGGVRVNWRMAERSELTDGDLITLGPVTLRFRQKPPDTKPSAGAEPVRAATESAA